MSKTNIWGEEIEDNSLPEDKRTHHNYKSLEYFGENKIAFVKELSNYHPELNEMLLTKHAHETDPEILSTLAVAEVAAYYEIILNGDYTPDEVENLCGILLQKLVNSRTAPKTTVIEVK